MTELEQLTDKWYEEYCYKNRCKQDVVNELNEIFSITLRNNDSSADNTSDEQLHSDEELMSKIEDITVDLHNSIPLSFSEYNLRKSFQFEDFQKELKKLFQTHRNTVFTAVKQKDDNLVDETDLANGIRVILHLNLESELNPFVPKKFSTIAEQILELFKTYQNSVLRPVNNSDE